MYFHYERAGSRAREILGDEQRKRGSGVVEVQLAVSRDGLAGTIALSTHPGRAGQRTGDRLELAADEAVIIAT